MPVCLELCVSEVKTKVGSYGRKVHHITDRRFTTLHGHWLIDWLKFQGGKVHMLHKYLYNTTIRQGIEIVNQIPRFQASLRLRLLCPCSESSGSVIWFLFANNYLFITSSNSICFTYVHRCLRDGEPRTAVSTFTQLLSSVITSVVYRTNTSLLRSVDSQCPAIFWFLKV